jgi:hypothetical protein
MLDGMVQAPAPPGRRFDTERDQHRPGNEPGHETGHIMADKTETSLRDAALAYHRDPKPGKLEIRATKPLANGRDLARAYSPGVAEASLEIKADPATALDYTARGNLVGVVSNGSAVLGLGNIGALAARHRTERVRPRETGRACLRDGTDLRGHQPRGYQGA